MIITALFIPQAILLYNAKEVLIWLGQPEVSAEYAGIYLRIIVPGMYLFCQTELLRRFLSTQGIFYLILNVQILTTILHTGWLYLFVNYLDWDIQGIAVAS